MLLVTDRSTALRGGHLTQPLEFRRYSNRVTAYLMATIRRIGIATSTTSRFSQPILQVLDRPLHPRPARVRQIERRHHQFGVGTGPDREPIPLATILDPTQPVQREGLVEAGQLHRPRELRLRPQPTVDPAQHPDVPRPERANRWGDPGQHAARSQHPRHLLEHLGEWRHHDQTHRTGDHIHRLVTKRQLQCIGPNPRPRSPVRRQRELVLGDVQADDRTPRLGQLPRHRARSAGQVDHDLGIHRDRPGEPPVRRVVAGERSGQHRLGDPRPLPVEVRQILAPVDLVVTHSDRLPRTRGQVRTHAIEGMGNIITDVSEEPTGPHR